MNKRKLLIIIFGTASVGLLVLLIYISTIWKGIKPVVTQPDKTIVDYFEERELQNQLTTSTEQVNGVPLTFSSDFSLSLFAKNVTGARDVVVSDSNEVWVSQPSQGVVSKINENSKLAEPQFSNLNRPHGIAFNPQNSQELYIAEESRVVKSLVSKQSSLETVVTLPSGGRHTTRSLLFTPQGELLVSIGSTCDVCEEKNPQHGSIQLINQETNTLEPYARGLRNSVFMTLGPEGGVWATEMGRDLLGDNLPPDEINVIQKDGFYGWPYYYGNNVRDQKFKPNVAVSLAYPLVPSKLDLPAHVAPLGLVFVPANSGWPEEYVGDLLVALHGSWNRSEPVGYKVVRIEFDEAGEFVRMEDFITGWLTEDNEALGRPVDLEFGLDGTLYISDDKAGVIYRVNYTNTGD